MPEWVILFIIIAFVVVAIYMGRAGAQAAVDLIRGGSDTWFGGGDTKAMRAAMSRMCVHQMGVVKDLRAHPRSRSEAEVIRHLESLTGSRFPTVNPPWLLWRGKTLELDGFNGRIALEFSGPLHTKWTPSFEPYTSYFSRIVKDVVKQRTCKRLKIPLIVIDASLPSRHWRAYLESRLADIGLMERKPTYIAKQTAIPWRNEQLEAEYNLAGEMMAAMAI